MQNGTSPTTDEQRVLDALVALPSRQEQMADSERRIAEGDLGEPMTMAQIRALLRS